MACAYETQLQTVTLFGPLAELPVDAALFEPGTRYVATDAPFEFVVVQASGTCLRTWRLPGSCGICPTGPTGATGATGAVGATGATGPASLFAAALKFSGDIATPPLDTPVFLADGGAAAGSATTTPQNYPIGEPTTAVRLSTFVDPATPVAPGGTVTFQLYRNGANVGTPIVYGPGTFGFASVVDPVPYAPGDTLDVGVVSTGAAAALLDVAATVDYTRP